MNVNPNHIGTPTLLSLRTEEVLLLLEGCFLSASSVVPSIHPLANPQVCLRNLEYRAKLSLFRAQEHSGLHIDTASSKDGDSRSLSHSKPQLGWHVL